MENEIVSNEDMQFFLAQDSAETDKMIAGMRALIKENENAYAAMKNQKWFQRIWFTITRKNSATIKEMQENKDKLSMYCVNVLARIVQQKALSDAMLVSLAASVRDMTKLHNQLQRVVYDLAQKLDEKINSVDHYQNLITDIQNGIFNKVGSFVGVIDILSRVDERTAGDSERLKRIKETMNRNCFDFNESVYAAKFGEQVLALSEESVGRIYLFAQNHRHLDFPAYACCLIELYFYALEADRTSMLEKVIHDAMGICHFTDRVSFSIDGVFEDLEKSVVDAFQDSKKNPVLSQVSARIYDINDRAAVSKTDSIHAIVNAYLEIMGKRKDYEAVLKVLSEKSQKSDEFLAILASELPYNTEGSVLGGEVFWTNLAESNGWKLQKNTIMENVRIIDNKNVRRAFSLNPDRLFGVMDKLVRKL